MNVRCPVCEASFQKEDCEQVHIWNDSDIWRCPGCGLGIHEPDLVKNQIIDGSEMLDDLSMPLSKWSKSEIMKACQQNNNIDRRALPMLDRLSASDLKIFALRMHHVGVTGSQSDPARRRHTKFYALDVDNINNMWNRVQ